MVKKCASKLTILEIQTFLPLFVSSELFRRITTEFCALKVLTLGRVTRRPSMAECWPLINMLPKLKQLTKLNKSTYDLLLSKKSNNKN